MIRNAIAISFAFIGIVVGAGFASGQEAMQYFVAFGTQGIWGALLSSALMLVGGISILQLGSYFQATEHMEVLGNITGKVMGWVLDISTIITLFSIGFIMFAGAGANLNQQFGIPVWIGAVIMLAMVLGVGMLDVNKVTGAIGILTPFLLIFVIGGCTWTIVNAQPDWDSINIAAQDVATELPNWWIAALNYTGLNFICVVSMAVVIGGNYLDPRETGLGGLFGGIAYLAMLLLLGMGLMVSISDVNGHDMPMLTLINNINPTLGLIMTFVIFGMIFATSLGMFYALGKRLARGRQQKFRVIYISACLIGFVLSFVGFKDLISFVYPILGYLGLVLIVVVTSARIRGSETLRHEGSLRRRALELMKDKLDPRVKFTRRDQRELDKITEKSVMENKDFKEAMIEEAEQALEAEEVLETEEAESQAK
ncbi:hypothetical protein [Corynebacterium pseudogenitalium]|uniref:YkvI family membrane protein n=1 Tax=Corynebacterium pseudogenitalium TaxID=38303 RepID=UPI0021087B18|nr:hypothetical protein [Corynebacterium pseudogenitalium]UUA87429.1 hypothetical protein KBP54_00795 [Corynebacterium pseudogenitalium]